MSNELLKNLEDLDNLLQKAQICRGGNSEVKEWAGSPHTDEKIPNNAPDGTNYKKVKTKAKKSTSEMTLEELELEVALRKSAIPNPRAAEEEILQLEGVTKSICPSCGGAGQDAINKSMCGVCGGHGIIFECSNEQSVMMAKSIADRYNVGEMAKGKKDHAEKGHGHAEKGHGHAKKGDTTPEDMAPYEEESEKNMYCSVSKADEDLDDLEATLKAMTKANGDDEEVEIEEEMEEMEMGKMGKSLEALNYGMRVLLKSIKEIMNSHEETSELVQALAKSQVSMTKSLTGVETAQPARAPLAAGPGLRVLEKGFVDSAPGGGATYDDNTLKKAASDMVYHGKLDAMEVLRMDSGVAVAPETRDQIENWIRTNSLKQ